MILAQNDLQQQNSHDTAPLKEVVFKANIFIAIKKNGSVT